MISSLSGFACAFFVCFFCVVWCGGWWVVVKREGIWEYEGEEMNVRRRMFGFGYGFGVKF